MVRKSGEQVKPIFLVVEGDEEKRTHVIDTLRELGYHNCESASDGAAAFHILKRRPIDCVICAWKLPQMSGLTLLKIISADDELYQLPFIIMTTVVDRETVVEAGKYGVSAVLLEPVQSSLLKIKIDGIFSGRIDNYNLEVNTFMAEAQKSGLTIKPLRAMINHATTEVFFDNLRVPARNLIGEEGKGFRYLLDGLNAERILISAEAIGDAHWFVEKACNYANERIVFDRPIGRNQGIQFPIARVHAETEAADLMLGKAIELFDGGQPCGPEANMAKLLAADASWAAADMCLQTHGGFGFAEEYDIERKFRETRLFQVAPISTNLILSYIAEHVLGLPRSF